MAESGSENRSRVNDPATVEHEYENEDRFLARRLAAWAELDGPLVEDAAIEAMVEAGATKVLEVGCGTGDFTERVQRELGVELEAIDLSERMVELTRERGLRAQVADIEALPFADGQFDCVLANRVLYHLPDLERGLREIARVLQPGGVLVAVTYSERHLHELDTLLDEPSRMGTEFSAETGGRDLERVFAAVERRDISGVARFPTRKALIGMASQRFGHSTDDRELARIRERVANVAVPFEATYHHAVFVARVTATAP